MTSTWDSAVGEEVHGLFFSTPGVTLFPGTLSKLEASREKFIARGERRGTEHLLTDILINEKSLEGVAPILTRDHELFHYMQLTSTPFGLALWQAEVALCDLLFEEVGEASHREITTNVESAMVVYEFVLALRGRQTLTMTEFLDLANRAQLVISHRWGFAPRSWVARDPDLDAYLPEGVAESQEVVEGAARIVELVLLGGERMDAPEWLMSEWDDTRLFGPYLRVVRDMRSTVGDLRVASQLCDLALLGGLASSVRTEGISIVVEEVLPGWRLKHLTDAVRHEILPWTREALTRFVYRELPTRAGLPPLSETWKAYGGSITNLGDRELRRREVGSLEDTQYHRWVIRRYARGFNYRRRGNAVHLLSDSASFGARLYKEGGFQPLLEFYGDGMLWNGLEIRRHPELAVKCYFELVRTTVVHATLGNNFDLRFLRQVEGNLDDRLTSLGEPRLRDQGLGVTHIVRSLIQNDDLLVRLNMSLESDS